MPSNVYERLLPGGALEVYADLAVPGTLGNLVGRTFGNYRLTSFIAAGGMSQVYRGSREDQQFERDVAVKIASSVALDDAYLARFLREQQVLASLNHPNIAQLYDVGLSNDGWPYIVMELVEGAPVDTHTAAQKLNTDAIVDLVVQIADALAFAHSRLIIHRDIKPNNVLVDGEGTPKLLDFGIAKQIDDTDSTLTQEHTPLTPRYASPEQLLSKPITVASDVYQLGALTVTLLAGESWGPDSLEDATANALQQTIEPLPKDLRTGLPKDLLLILQTALQPDPERRYATAAAFAADLKRYRDGFPIQARAPSARYYLSRFVKRNPRPVGIAASALVVIVLGSAWYAQSLAESRAEAENAAQQAQAINRFLLDMFKRVSPVEGGTADLSARELLAQSLDDIEALADQPDIQSGVQYAIGEVYLALGDLERAQLLLESAFATRNQIDAAGVDEVAQSMMSLGILAFDHARFDDALAHYREAEALLLTKYAADDKALIRPLHLIGNVYIRLGDIAQAQKTIRQTLALRQQHLDGFHQEIGISFDVLALLATWEGNLEEAAELFAQAHEQFEQSNSTQTTAYAGSLDNYGRMLGERGEHAESLEYHLRANSIFNELYGIDHPHVAQSNHRIAMVYQRLEDYPAAISYAKRSIDIYRRISDPPNFMILSPLYTLAEVQRSVGQTEDAVRAGEQALHFAKVGFAEGHWRIGSLMSNVGGLYHAAGRTAQARAHLEQGLQIIQAGDMAGTVAEVFALKGLGDFLYDEGATDEALTFLTRALQMAEEVSPDVEVTVKLRQRLAELEISS